MPHHVRVREGAFPERMERFASVDSTQRIVREWLDAGTRGVCVAVADEQTAGRGRQGRAWTAPRGAALLVSAGFTLRALRLRHAWRLAALVALAMIDAAEEVAGLPAGALWLKWPNDIVSLGPEGRLLKLAGVLGETVADGDAVASAVIGIGVNADWAAADFPPDLAPTMTSLRELSGGRAIDREALLQAWLAGLASGTRVLESGVFDAEAWSPRQVTTGRRVEVDLGGSRIEGLATGVDAETGALLLVSDGQRLVIDSGEVVRCRVIADLSRDTK